MPPSVSERVLTRATLAECTERVLRHASKGKPAIVLARVGDQLVLVKDFGPNHWYYTIMYGRWLVMRECRIYRLLDGVPGIPRFRGKIDSLAFAVDYIDGQDLKKVARKTLRPETFDQLEGLLEAIHARGVIHLDAHQKKNVLLDAEGRPYLVDFATAVYLGTGWLARRLLVPFFGSVDRAGYLKLKGRYCAGALTPLERRHRRFVRVAEWIWPPTTWRKICRKLFPRKRKRSQRGSSMSDGS